jgi:hypothetical protein
MAVEGRLQSFAAAWPRDRGAADRWAESTVVARANTPFTVRSASTYCLIVRRFDRAGVRTERDSNNLLSTPTRTEPTLVTLQTPAGREMPMSAGSRILLEDPGEWTVVVELDSRYRSSGNAAVELELSNTLDLVFAARHGDGEC